MDSLSQLCDVLSQNVTLADQRAPWLWRQSSRPQPSAHFPFFPAQLQGVLAIARLLAQCQDLQSRGDLVLVLLDFIRTLPSLPKEAPFPKAPGLVDGASRFFMELTRHLVKIVESGRADAEHISGVMANVIQAMVSAGSGEDASSSASRAFLSALAQNCPRFHPSDVDRVSACLLEHWILPAQAGMLPSSSSETSAQGSPFVKKYLTTSLSNGAISPDEKHTDSPDRESLDYHDRLEERGGNRNFKEGISPVSTPSTTPNATPSTTPLKISDNLEERADNFEEQGVPVSMKVNGNVAGRGSLDQLTWAHRLTDNRSSNFKQQLLALQDETLESLEKQQTALRILAGILDKTETNVALKDSFLRQLRIVVTKHLKALPSFLKLRKRDWPAAGIPLKLKINVKLQVSQAAVLVHTKCFLKMEVDGKAFKSLLRETLALLLDAADACVISPWRKLNACEELFSSVLSGVAQTAAARGSHILRVLLLRLKNLILATCAQADTWGNSQGPMFDSIVEASCKIVNAGWNWDRPAVESFLLALAANICELGEQEEKEKQVASMMQLNVIHLLADVAILMNKPDVVEMILPRFIERLEEGDASVPSHLRLRLLDAVARMASLGFEKSYRETVVLLTRSYLDKLSTVGSTQSRTLAPEATTERVETLPRAFLTIATGLKQAKLRSDYRHRLLILCSDVGLAAEAKSGKSGADLLGPLLPAVAEICSDFEPCQDLEPSLFKLFRNLWFYIVLFGLAPPIQKIQTSSKSISSSTASLGSSSAMALQAVAGPYMWNIQWLTAVQRITEGTPPLVVSPVKWLEDELELNELHNPESRRGSSNEKAAIGQRAALSAALGGRVEIGSMNSISGVKATYLLAVAFLEILRLSYNGGILRSSSMEEGKKSALRCAFEYLETPNLMPAVYQCLTAVVHRAFDAALAWLEEKITAAGNEAEERESVLISHACFLITNMTHREENVRELSGSLLSQLKSKFPQILWNSSCMDSLLQLVGNYTPPSMVADLSGVASLRSFLQRQVREWVLQALLLAPCTTHGLLQEQFRKLITWPKASHTTDLLSVLSEIRLDSTRSEGWNNSQTVSVPAVLAAAAAAAGASPYMAEVGSLEVLSTGIVGANVKSNYIYVSIGGLTLGQGHLVNSGSGTFLGNMLGHGGGKLSPDRYMPAEKRSLNEMLIARFLQLLQQFVTTAERGAPIDTGAFRETCLQATALLLSDTGICRKGDLEGFSQLIRLLCWCPAYISTPEAMETGVFVWTWVVSAAPHLDSLVLAELVDAWLWTIDTGYGLFASGVTNSGPAASLRPHLTPGEPVSLPSRDPVEGITAHRLWLGFLLDRFEVVRHSNTEQLLLVGRLLEGSLRSPEHFSCHPAATGAFFTLMLLGLKFCSSQIQNASPIRSMGLHLLEDRVYRAALAWFAVDPGWYDSNMEGLSQAEAQAVAVFVQHLALERPETFGQGETHGRTHFHEGDVLQNSNVTAQLENAHPVWGKMDNYVIGREKRKQLLLLLCQHEADRMDTWGNPLKDSTPPRLRVSSDRWIEYVRTAWSVDPRIALALVTRFPAVAMLRSEVTSMVQTHISDLYVIPEALPYFVTPKAVEENSSVLQHLPHWAPCSITRVLEFLTPSYKGHPRVMAYVLRVLESYPPEKVTFFMPQLLQALRYDDGDLVQRYLMSAAQRSNLFAHILIWQLQGEEPPPSEDAVKESAKANPFHEMVLKVKQRIVDSFTPEAYDMYLREFRFFDKVTDISGVLFPLPKEQRRAAIKRELEKIKVEGDDLYLPTAPNKLVRGIQLDSGIPLQSAAKVPIMIRFNVVEKDGDPFDVKPQACIFKVGDDCRQDVLALQVIALLRDIFQAVHLNLYLFPYGVLPTGCGKGIIEVVPNTRSRNEMGETTDGGLYEIFQQEYGPVGSPRFEAARDKFIVSSAGYAVASLLLQPKDRHNGNLLFDSEGRLVHIDFGFILETSPGGNLRFESAQFKLSHEMTQLLDPSGVMKSEKWIRFVSLCVKGYLAARQHMDGIINTVLLMVDSGLPCFSRGDPIGNLRKRFHPEMSEREAANFMMKTCADAYNKWSTAGYDLIQYLQQGIEK